MPTRRNVLISGASVAGPTLAYWLHRHGFRTTVVERAPSLRRGWGGQAVDLFGPAVDVAERMGILPQVLQARTRTELISFARPDKPPVDVDFTRLVAGISDRHVEIMRGEPAAILHDATRDNVEYLFGDGIRSLAQDDGGVDVTFERSAPRRFDLVIGADGIHSTVRHLTFGSESRFRRYIGGYLAVYTVPNHLQLHGRMLTYLTPGKLAATYPVRQTGQARAAFLFRPSSAAPGNWTTTTATSTVRNSCSATSMPPKGGRLPAYSASWTGPTTSTSTRSARSSWTAGPTAGSPWSATPGTPPARLWAAAPASQSSAPTSSPQPCTTPAETTPARSTSTRTRCAMSCSAAAGSAPPP